MIYLFLFFRLCLGETIEKTTYLQENEFYQQGLYELFNDTIDHQYSFINSTKKFYISDSNIKQEQTGKYATNPTNIIIQKQYRNLDDQQGIQKYGILFEDEDKKHKLCYNSDVNNLDIDICIQLDNDKYGYDFIFIDYDTVAISSFINNIFYIVIYQGNTLIRQFQYEPTIYSQSLITTKIAMMLYNNEKYLIVVGIYPINQEFTKLDVLLIQSDYTIETSPYSFKMNNVQDIKGSDNGTIFLNSFIDNQLFFKLELQKDGWLITIHQKVNYSSFDLGYSTIDGESFRSFILVSDTYYQLQSTDNKINIKNYHQLQINKESSSKEFINNKQFQKQHTKDKLYQLINSVNRCLAFQGQTTDTLDIVKITNGQKQVHINFRVLETSDYNLYQLTNEVIKIYYNSIYSTGPFNIPVPTSGFDPKLQVFTDKQLKLEAKNYQVLEARFNVYLPIFQQILVINDRTSIFKQYQTQYEVRQCFQNNQILDCNYTIQSSSTINKQIKLYTQQGVNQGYLILVNNYIEIYADYYRYYQIQDQENISDIIAMDKLFVVYETFIKVYTYPKAVEIQKIEIQQLKIDNAIKIWGNNLYNNYIFILSKLGQLAIGQFTNRFYLRQIIQFENTNIDISIVATDKIIISQQNNDNSIEVSLYNIVNEKIIKQYPLDLHNYTITNYILQKDYLNGLIGIEAHLDKQNALLLYGFRNLKRDQLQKIIYLDEDYDSISICSNKDQTQILQTQTQGPNLKIFYVHHQYQYVHVSQSEYLITQFIQELPITYFYSSNQDNNQNFTIKNQIFYQNDYKTVGCKQQLIEITHKSDQEQFEYELPKNLFTGQVSYIRTTNNPQIQLETRVKNQQRIEAFGYHPLCKQVTRYERILCLHEDLLTYHKYNGDIIQKVEFYYYFSDNLKINIDNSNAIIFQDGQSLINISQNSIYLYQNKVNYWIGSFITYYKKWIICYDNNRLQFYYIINDDENWDLQYQYNLNLSDISDMSGLDYHPQSQSIHYTQYSNSLLSIIKCSLESDLLNVGQIKTYDIQEYLYKYQIYTTDLKLNYLKIFDNNIVISSNYGHIYTFDIETFSLINIYIITGPNAQVKEINIFDKYLIMKGENQLFLYENTNDQNIKKPYLSLESIYNLYDIDLVALYQDDNNITNILLYDRYAYLVNSIIDDRYLLKFSNLSENPAPFYIVGGNPYNSTQILINSIRKDDNSWNVWTIIIIAIIIGSILLVGILVYIYQKKNQPTENPIMIN